VLALVPPATPQSWRASRSRVPQPGATAAANGGVHALPAVVSREAVRDAGLVELRDYLGLGELGAGDQLKQVEGCTVEGVGTVARRCGSKCSDFGSQSGVAERTAGCSSRCGI
jgi:hypothetical protein